MCFSDGPQATERDRGSAVLLFTSTCPVVHILAQVVTPFFFFFTPPSEQEGVVGSGVKVWVGEFCASVFVALWIV